MKLSSYFPNIQNIKTSVSRSCGNLKSRLVTSLNSPNSKKIVGASILGIGIASIIGRSLLDRKILNLNNRGSIILLCTGFGILFIYTRMKKEIEKKEIKLPPTFTPIQPFDDFASFILRGATTKISGNYEDATLDGVLDLAIADREHCFGLIVDGTGHGNPRMKEPLENCFEGFKAKYAQGLAQAKSFEEVTAYFTTSVRDLEAQFRMVDSPFANAKICPPEKETNDKVLGTFLDDTYKPAVTFVQVVKLQDNRLMLLTVQAGDTMVVVHMNDGTLLRTQKSVGYGFGDTFRVAPIQIFDITGAKKIIGFSDGIGEFITFDELQSIVVENHPDNLFNKLKEKVNDFDCDRVVKNVQAANGRPLKQYNYFVPELSDDMGLFVLEVQQ